MRSAPTCILAPLMQEGISAPRDAAVRGYRRYVQPGHPVLGRIFPPAAPREEALVGEGARALAAFPYEPFLGFVPFEDVAGALGRGGVRLNCLTSACLLASFLRTSGFSPSEVFVLIGDDRDHPRNSLHAWVGVLRGGGEVLWTDPASLRPVPRPAEEVLARIRCHVLFNDMRLEFLDAAKRRWLTGGEYRSGLRTYCYGTVPPGLTGLLGQGGAFARRLESLFRCGPEGTDAEAQEDEASERLGLLVRAGSRWRPGPRLILVPKEQDAELRSLVDVCLDRHVSVLRQALPRLQQAWQRTAARHDAWPDVWHTVVAGILMDVAVGAHTRPYLPPSTDWLLCAFENMTAGHPFGVQYSPNLGGGFGFGQLWHPYSQRPRIPEPSLRALAALASEGRSTPPELMRLARLQLVRREGSAVRPTVPVLEEADPLAEPVHDAAARIAEEVYGPALAAAARHPWWRRVDGHPGVRFAALRLLLEYATDRALDAGVLPPFPMVVPGPGWGRWLWRGDAWRRFEPQAAAAAKGTAAACR
jgi:hypothetical protein